MEKYSVKKYAVSVCAYGQVYVEAVDRADAFAKAMGTTQTGDIYAPIVVIDDTGGAEGAIRLLE